MKPLQSLSPARPIASPRQIVKNIAANAAYNDTSSDGNYSQKEIIAQSKDKSPKHEDSFTSDVGQPSHHRRVPSNQNVMFILNKDPSLKKLKRDKSIGDQSSLLA